MATSVFPSPVRIFSVFAAVEDNAADQLHVEMAHVQEAAAGFADHGESFNQQVVEGRALGQLFLELDGLGGEVDIGELLDGWFQVVDGGDEGLNGLDFARVFGAKNLGQDCVNRREVSLQSGDPRRGSAAPLPARASSWMPQSAAATRPW